MSTPNIGPKKIVLFKDTANDRTAFVNTIETQLLPLFEGHSPSALKITLTKTAPPAMGVIPYCKTAIACISVTGEIPPLKTLSQEPHFYGVYDVTEALPVSYEMNWETNTPTPGACLLTLFNRKKNLDDKTFYHRWHNGHTPLSLKIHPLWNYVRNVVDQTLDGRHFDGIVEEQVKDKPHLLNPAVFFGGPLVMLKNMILTFFDTKSFIDYPTMETYLAEETWIIK